MASELQRNAMEAAAKGSVLIQNMSLLQKACSSTEDTPGFVYEELIHLTFRSADTSKHLAQFFASKLAANSQNISSVTFRTLKSVDHLCRRGSKHFRQYFRDQDAGLRDIEMPGLPILDSSNITNRTRIIAKALRSYIFDDGLMSSDKLNIKEVAPRDLHLLCGMGGTAQTSSTSSQSSKYLGFGNAPVSKSHFGFRLREMVEKVVSPPDERAEVLKSCLAAPDTGTYEPVLLMEQITFKESPNPSVDMSTSRLSLSSSTVSPVRHVPGKPGGGWASDEEDEEEEEEEKRLGVSTCSSSTVEIASEALEDSVYGQDSPEKQLVEDFCHKTHFPTLTEMNSAVRQVYELNCANVVAHLGHLCKLDVSQKAHRSVIFRSLILLDFLLETDLVQPGVYQQILMPSLEAISALPIKDPKNIQYKNPEDLNLIKIKATKILLILKALLKQDIDL